MPPPIAVITAMALRNVSRVRMSLGLWLAAMAPCRALADSAALSAFSASSAAIVDSPAAETKTVAKYVLAHAEELLAISVEHVQRRVGLFARGRWLPESALQAMLEAAEK